MRQEFCFGDDPQIMSWGLSGILNDDLNSDHGRIFGATECDDTLGIGDDIGPQLPFGVSVGALNEANGCNPKHPSYDAKKPFPRPDPQDRYLGSVITAMLVLWLASPICWKGWQIIGGIVTAYGIFGLLLQSDLWSLAVRIV